MPCSDDGTRRGGQTNPLSVGTTLSRTMRAAALLSVLLLAASLLSPLAWEGGGLPREGSGTSAPDLLALQAPPPAGFLLEPADGQWFRFAPDFIRIFIQDAASEFDPEASVLLLDGESVAFSWSPALGVVESVLQGEMDDGLHVVEATLSLGGSVTELTWSFGLDTHVPLVVVEPLPSLTEEQVLEIRGIVNDPWLADLMVQGRGVALEDGSFSVEVRLWPGLNDIVVEAEDLAGNLRRVTRTVRLQTPVYAGDSEVRVLENASFRVALPEEWVAQENVRMTSGARADLIALAPLRTGLQTTLTVASEPSDLAYSRSRALEWMGLLLAGVEASGQLVQVVSQPRLVENFTGTVAVQSTFLRHTASERVAFMHVTMVWSHLLRHQWILLASTDERRAVEMWPEINATVSSFTVLDEGVGEPEAPPSPFLLPTLLVAGAIVVLSAILGAVLLPMYLARRRKRKEAEWRPPRNWGRL